MATYAQIFYGEKLAAKRGFRSFADAYAQLYEVDGQETPVNARDILWRRASDTISWLKVGGVGTAEMYPGHIEARVVALVGDLAGGTYMDRLRFDWPDTQRGRRLRSIAEAELTRIEREGLPQTIGARSRPRRARRARPTAKPYRLRPLV